MNRPDKTSQRAQIWALVKHALRRRTYTVLGDSWFSVALAICLYSNLIFVLPTFFVKQMTSGARIATTALILFLTWSWCSQALSTPERPTRMLPLFRTFRANWMWFEAVLMMPIVLALAVLPVTVISAFAYTTLAPLAVAPLAFLTTLAFSGTLCFASVTRLQRTLSRVGGRQERGEPLPKRLPVRGVFAAYAGVVLLFIRAPLAIQFLGPLEITALVVGLTFAALSFKHRLWLADVGMQRPEPLRITIPLPFKAGKPAPQTGIAHHSRLWHEIHAFVVPVVTTLIVMGILFVGLMAVFHIMRVVRGEDQTAAYTSLSSAAFCVGMVPLLCGAFVTQLFPMRIFRMLPVSGTGLTLRAAGLTAVFNGAGLIIVLSLTYVCSATLPRNVLSILCAATGFSLLLAACLSVAFRDSGFKLRFTWLFALEGRVLFSAVLGAVVWIDGVMNLFGLPREFPFDGHGFLFYLFPEPVCGTLRMILVPLGLWALHTIITRSRYPYLANVFVQHMAQR